jgi:hypothetical protein
MRPLKAIVIALVLVISIAISPGAASAGDGPSASAGPDLTVSVQSTQVVGGGGGTAPSPATGSGGGNTAGPPSPAQVTITEIACATAGGLAAVGVAGAVPSQTAPSAPAVGGAAAPPPPTSAVVVATSARAQLVLPLPDAQLAPPPDVDQIVGVATWLWLSPDQWQPLSRTASVPGVSATVTARPQSITWDAGDGTSLDCAGPGLAFEPGRTASDCTHVYLDRGDVTTTITVHWQLDWTSSVGAGGSLGTVDRSTTIPLHVVEVQATTN